MLITYTFFTYYELLWLLSILILVITHNLYPYLHITGPYSSSIIVP